MVTVGALAFGALNEADVTLAFLFIKLQCSPSLDSSEKSWETM